MELIQLEMFIAVYEERSFQRAAEKVYRTQPAVSLALTRLEKEVGTRLLERRRGRREELHLTKAGALVYEYASRMIGLRNELDSALLPGKRRPGERLRLGVSEGWPSEWVGRVIGRFRKRCPHVRVGVWYVPSEVLFQEVRERRIDLAILDAVPGLVDGNMETMWIPSSVDTGRSGEGQTAWLLRNRVGRSHASLEFEQELSSLIFDEGEKHSRAAQNGRSNGGGARVRNSSSHSTRGRRLAVGAREAER
jgi:DNA-binding transcriptional LysR family regulator